MKNSINVYWSYHPDSIPLNILSIPPKLVINDIKDHISSDPDLSPYLKCPAFTNEFKNTYVIKSPLDFDINIDQRNHNQILPEGQPPYPRINCRSFKNKVYDIDISTLFFSEEDLEISLIPSSLHINNFTTYAKPFPGKFNIGKWFRPLMPTSKLILPHIKVKRGEVLFYIKFNTDKKIKFINFEFNKEIHKIAQECSYLKSYKSGYLFKDIYNMFTQIGYHKKLLKEIKKNTTDLK